jgi:hypothetical protein
MNNNLSEEFFFNGYSQIELKDSPVKKAFLNSITNARNNNFDQNKFSWKSKYHGTEDFKDSVFDFDTSFIDVLFDNDIPNLIEKYINYKRVTLGHIQLRKSYPGNSYMDWHRDNYLDNGKAIGVFPPSVKIIFYPICEQQEDCLKVIPGSHIRFFKDRKQDSEVNSKFPSEVIQSTNDKMLLFDTSLWHGAVNGNNKKGSVRVIYSFINKDQYLENFSKQAIHQRINDYYEERL